jgi:hypothetical protein
VSIRDAGEDHPHRDVSAAVAVHVCACLCVCICMAFTKGREKVLYKVSSSSPEVHHYICLTVSMCVRVQVL